MIADNLYDIILCRVNICMEYERYTSPLCGNYKITLALVKTIQHLATRVKEHGTSPSAVLNHLSSCETCKSNFSCNNFSITESGKNDYDITLKEALHIKFKRPTINKQLFTQGTSFVVSIFST